MKVPCFQVLLCTYVKPFNNRSFPLTLHLGMKGNHVPCFLYQLVFNMELITNFMVNVKLLEAWKAQSLGASPAPGTSASKPFATQISGYNSGFTLFVLANYTEIQKYRNEA